MSRLFTRLFFVVVLTLFIASWSLDYIFERYVEEPVDKSRHLLEQTIRMAVYALSEKATGELEPLFDRLQKNMAVPVTLDPMEEWELPLEDQQMLQRGETIEWESEQGRLMLIGLKQSDKILVFGPIPGKIKQKYFEYMLLGVFLLILAGALMLWIWPHWRNLEKLSAASLAFGQGNLGARAQLSDNSAISELAKTFNSMADRIQTLIQSHKHLTSAVAHELRTPISRIRFSLEMLQSADDKDMERHLSYMHQDVDELDKLIAEMMTYARLERGTPPMKIQSLTIVPWLQQVLDRTKTEASTKTVAFRYDEQFEQVNVKCYAPYLERAIMNLVSNAMRYAQANIVVEFVCRDKRCWIFVDDDGPGIPENKREQALLPFTRLDDGTEAKSLNFGLGLSIVEQIAKWHDGVISIEESPLSGARFIFSWPCQADLSASTEITTDGTTVV